MSLIQINNLTFTYEGSFDPVFENVSFQIDTDWKKGFILVSHDRDFLDRCVDHVLVLNRRICSSGMSR